MAQPKEKKIFTHWKRVAKKKLVMAVVKHSSVSGESRNGLATGMHNV
jgi:hypothetical protein